MKSFLKKVADRLLNGAYAFALVAAFALFGAAPASAFDIAVGATTATATSGAATIANSFGVVTSEALTTAAAAAYTLTLTDTAILASDVCLASVAYGTSTTGNPAIQRVTPAAGSLVILVQNIAASAALNGTIVVSFACFKA